MIKRKVLLIENQLKQFNLLTRLLEAESDFLKYETHEERLEVYPLPDDYIRIHDLVRIYLGPYYRQQRKDQALELLLSYIRSVGAELFIIDYVLSGTYDGGTGITLWRAIQNKDRSFSAVPVMFLSRTLRNDKKVKETLPADQNIVWVEKGYAGFENLEPTYFENHVKKIIPGVIGNSDFSKQLKLIETLHFVYAGFPELRGLLNAYSNQLLENTESQKTNLDILETLVQKKLNLTTEHIKHELQKLSVGA